MIVIDGYTIDIAVSEDHSRTAQATAHPIESGSDITDHIIERPKVITLNCLVSDTPIGRLKTLREETGFLVGNATEGFVPSDDAHDFLNRLFDERRPVQIDHSLGVDDNMIMTSLSEPRRSSDGKALRFTVAFQQIRIVENERRTVIVATPRSKRKRNRGNKAGEVVNDQANASSKQVKGKKSVLAGLADRTGAPTVDLITGLIP